MTPKSSYLILTIKCSWCIYDVFYCPRFMWLTIFTLLVCVMRSSFFRLRATHKFSGKQNFIKTKLYFRSWIFVKMSQIPEVSIGRSYHLFTSAHYLNKLYFEKCITESNRMEIYDSIHSFQYKICNLIRLLRNEWLDLCHSLLGR